MPATPALLALVAALLVPQQQIQHPADPSDTVEQALARAIVDAMPDVQRPWMLDWSNFGVRGGRDIFWRLAPPRPYLPRPLPEGVHRRTGWISVRGGSGDVAACGDEERVGGLAVRLSSWASEQGDLIGELTARNVRVTLLETREADLAGLEGNDRASAYYREFLLARPALQRWRLERDGREPVELSAAHSCTPPGTRHATHCWITWRVAFRPDAPLPGADCPLPGRYGD